VGDSKYCILVCASGFALMFSALIKLELCIVEVGAMSIVCDWGIVVFSSPMSIILRSQNLNDKNAISVCLHRNLSAILH
jgi:hypothetical protein